MKTLKILIATIFFLCYFVLSAFSQCQQIDTDVKVTNTTNDSDNGSIVLEIKGNLNKDNLTVSVFAPDRKKNQLGISKFTIDNLQRGKYLIIVSAKREEDNICPKSINVTIN